MSRTDKEVEVAVKRLRHFVFYASDVQDLFDNWAKTFGYDYWQWGSFSELLGALGTIGAFLFGFWLLSREIDEKRRRHADAFITHFIYVRHPFNDEWKRYIEAHNSGTHAVTEVTVFERGKAGPDMIGVMGERDGLRMKFAPRFEGRLTIDLDGPPDDKKLFIEFTDIAGRTWRRSVDSGTYISRRRYNWTYWGTWFGTEPNKAKIRKRAGMQAFQPASRDDLDRIAALNKKEAEDDAKVGEPE